MRRRSKGARPAWTIGLAAVVLSVASPVDARPKRRTAKAAFDRGLAAYNKHNFQAASDALARSYELERDADTLYAWAQAQRQLEHCDKAIELYDQLLTFELPAANRAAVYDKLTECRDLIAAQQGKPPSANRLPDDPPAAASPTPAETPVATRSPAPAPAAPRPAPPPPERRSWYRDPVALALLGSGVVASGAGGGLLLSARSLDSDSKAAFQGNRYDDAVSLARKARSRGDIGAITLGVGGALIVGGVVWLVVRPGGDEQPVVTGWLPDGGVGLAVTGGF